MASSGFLKLIMNAIDEINEFDKRSKEQRAGTSARNAEADRQKPPNQPSTEVLRLRTELSAAKNRAADAETVARAAIERLNLAFQRYSRRTGGQWEAIEAQSLLEAIGTAAFVIEDLAAGPQASPLDSKRQESDALRALRTLVTDLEAQQRADTQAISKLLERVNELEARKNPPPPPRRRSTPKKTGGSS